MTLILGNISDGFVDDGVVWYEFMSKLVANINGYVLIDTCGMIWVSAVGWFLGGNVIATINLSVRTGIGIL